MALALPRWAVRLALAFALAFGLGYLPHHLYSRTGLLRLMQLQRSLTQLRGRNQAARAENTELRARAAALRADTAALERVARDELGLVKSGEILYQLEDGRP
jgi:cell division protein FtsB